MSLRQNVKNHTGKFVCEEIGNEKNQKIISFMHIATEPNDCHIPVVPGLKEFYDLFGTLELYKDRESGESAYYIGAPNEWGDLEESFYPWIEDNEEHLPSWMVDRLVVGEIPASGNYLLVAKEGSEAGKVFEFEHDGFEFIELADSLSNFVESAIDPNSNRLTGMATHMRFVAEGSDAQWWIKELRDSQGRIISTEA